MVTKTARTRQPTREMQRRCRRKRRAKMVRRLLYAAAVLLVAVAVAIVLYGGSPLHASAEPQPVAAPADTPVQAEPTAQPAAPGQYVVAIDPGHGGINPTSGPRTGAVRPTACGRATSHCAPPNYCARNWRRMTALRPC